MRLRRQTKVERAEAERAKALKEAMEKIFPVKLYVLGISHNGEEVIRFDLGCSFTSFDQTLNLTELGPLVFDASDV